jgi:ABC-type bacteriocin/lantibiotic exporter with double-glycine peptidase domain
MGTFLNLRIESFYIYEITGTDLHAIFSPKGIDNFETDGISLEPFRGEIEFQDVRFTYPTNKDVVVSFMSSTGFPNKRCSIASDNETCSRTSQVLNHFNMRIPGGSKVALVGINGCGKSTVMKLLCKEYLPDSGFVSRI